MLTKRNSNLPLVCLICGDTARGMNFNVMSCLSCKTFFRRHNSNLKKKARRCAKENNCEINVITRSTCVACRLNKCLTLGMDPDIIGNRRVSLPKLTHGEHVKISPQTRNLHLLPQPCTLSLLQNDRSTLSRNEWDLFSNIIHAYDATEILPDMKQILEVRSRLPLKVRSKRTMPNDLTHKFFLGFIPFIQRTSFYHELPTNTYSEIVQNNFGGFGTFQSGFLIRELECMSYSLFRNVVSTIYTGDIVSVIHNYISKLESNNSLLKIILMIVAFSTNYDIVTFDPSKTDLIFGNSISILNVQNTIVTMFWKYLLYQYGFESAVKKFSSHVKYMLDVLNGMYAYENVQNVQNMYKMVNDTKRALIIKD